MWIVRTKDSSVLGFYLPDSDYIGAVNEKRRQLGQQPVSFETWKQQSKPIRSDCPDSYEGWASPWCDEHRVIDLTVELHSKFPYLDYYNEPLWVDMFDPEISKVVSKS
jgi:hypothetical protein